MSRKFGCSICGKVKDEIADGQVCWPCSQELLEDRKRLEKYFGQSTYRVVNWNGEWEVWDNYSDRGLTSTHSTFREAIDAIPEEE